MKYMPDFPDRFGSLADARTFCDEFFTAYNHEHRHSGIGWHTPASVHYGTAEQIRTAPPGHPDRRLRPAPRPVHPPAPSTPTTRESLDQPANNRGTNRLNLT